MMAEKTDGSGRMLEPFPTMNNAAVKASLTPPVAASEGYFVSDTLRGRHGYLYGWCARQLHYWSKIKEISRTEDDKKAIDWGNKMHMIYESQLQNKWPEWSLKTEQNFKRELPEEIYGVKYVSVTADLEGAKKVIEIKPRYSMRAYIQTLVQKYVLPKHDFMVYAYSKRELFPIKADAKMASIYVARILTALKFLPPRVPNANAERAPCATCQFKQRCWTEEDSDWATFKQQSQYAVERV